MSIFLLLFVVILWLLIVSILLFRTLGNYNRLTRGATDETLSDVLNRLLQQEKKNEEDRAHILQELKGLRRQSLSFIQKIGLVRFNPFADTGGDQSFVIALLDGEDNGIVVTSLYARTGTRWYAKTIHKGRAIEYDLSKEEEKAIKQATQTKK